jgi:ERCC4-type nuclease
VLLIDPRRGSGEFSSLFSSYSIEIFKEHLEFGDFAFSGSSFDGDCSIGVERKALDDFLACCNDSRFIGHQLPGLLDSYHYSVLLIEGTFRPDREGYIEELVPVWHRGQPSEKIFQWKRLHQGKRAVLFSTLSGHLNTLRLKAGRPNAGFLVMQTADKLSTTFEVAALYRWFQKPWDEHRSHIGFFDPASVLNVKSSLVRRVAMQLPNIGYERSALVDKTFRSVQDMANSNEERWSELDGIGKKTAAQVVKALRGK